MATTIRHRTAPAPNACRWCGVDERRHAVSWTPAVGYHSWQEPTVQQRRARFMSRRAA